MTGLVTGALWAALVLCLLVRALRQWRTYRIASLGPPVARDERPSVAIIVPVRDEIANVAACLGALSRQGGLGETSEIIVVDDESRDGTPEAVERVAAAEPRIRLIRSGSLPAQWMGKPHACWRGALAARAEWLCFIDADVRAAPRLVATAIAAAERHGIDMLSLAPFQQLGGFWERLVVPAGLVLMACTIDLRRFADPASPEVTANGQFLLFRRDAYFAVGGHAAVRREVCEDRALAGRIKQAGRRFRLLGAEHLATTRMYTDRASLWEGFSKNAVEILGSGAATLAAATAGLAVAWAALAVPAALAPALLGKPAPVALAGFALGLLGSLTILGVHIGTVRHLRIPPVYALLFPAAYAAVAAIAWRSVGLRRGGRISWKGRTYEIDRNVASPRPR
jgi:chlorobactene glucosyltransferase